MVWIFTCLFSVCYCLVIRYVFAVALLIGCGDCSCLLWFNFLIGFLGSLFGF